MAKDKLGSIRLVSTEPDGTCIWRVKAEKRTGGRRSITRTIRGTERDARILAAELAKQLDSSIDSEDMPKVTLDEYYFGMYRPWMEASGCTREHIRNVDANYEKHIRPKPRAGPCSTLAEDEVRVLIKIVGGEEHPSLLPGDPEQGIRGQVHRPQAGPEKIRNQLQEDLSTQTGAMERR